MTDPPPADRAPRTVPLAIFAVVSVIAVVMALLASLAVLTSDDSSAASDTAPRQAAGRFAELLFTFDHEALDQWRSALLASSTGGFAQEFEQAERGLRTVIESSELRGEAEAREVFISDISGGAASAIVILDYRTIGPDGPKSVSDEPIRLELVRVDGVWLVADVKTVGGASALTGFG